MPFNILWIDAASGDQRRLDFDTPVGRMVLTMRGDVIIDADWAASGRSPDSGATFSLQPADYWQTPGAVVTVKLLKQGSAYRQRVWAALCAIPVGATMTYAALAQQLASSARAVGNACRDNPYPLFIPCHRVVAASGLGGYCGQTLGDLMTIKQRLLAFEAGWSDDGR